MGTSGLDRVRRVLPRAGAWKVYALLAVLLAFSLFSVRMNVLFSYWSNDFFSSLQYGAEAMATKNAAGLEDSKAFFWSALGLFGILATIHVIRALIAYFIGEAFEIRWRLWLTDHVTADWLTGNAYYRNRFIDETIDNPDQRIQADVTSFVSTSRSLAFGAISSVVTVISFSKVLWDLSGPLNLFGLEIPRAMMFIVLIYVLLTTVVAFWLGHPLIRLNFIYEAVTANFRYALVRVRDGAENIAFYRGENVERAGLFARFRAVIANYWQIVYRTLKFDGWNLSVNQVAVIFPFLIQGPRFFQGQVTFGDMTQTADAFGQMHDSLSFFREAYDQFASYRASTMRLHGLLTADDQSRDLPRIAAADTDRGVQISNVDVRRPDGVLLIDDLDLRLVAGEALVIKGASGSGKTTLLRTLAQIWPYADGSMSAPAGNDTLFLSQIPYLPLATCARPSPIRRGRGHRRRGHEADAHEGVAPASGRPARRRRRLVEGALPRRAAAHRIRPHPADPSAGRVPRRGDVGHRRGPGVRALPAHPHRAAGDDPGQRRAPQHRRRAPHPEAGAVRHRRLGAGAGRSPLGELQQELAAAAGRLGVALDQEDEQVDAVAPRRLGCSAPPPVA